MMLGVALFRNDIHDFMQISTTTANTVSSTIVNVGEVQIQGFEVELSGMITDNFSYQASLGILDAKYKELNISATTNPLDWKLNQVPDTTGSLSLIYDTELSDIGYLSFMGNVAHVAESAAGFNPEENPNIIEANTKVNVSATFESLDDNWKVVVAGKNITNEETVGNRFYVGSYLIEAINPGVTWSLSAEYKF